MDRTATPSLLRSVPRVELGDDRRELDPRRGFHSLGDFASAVLRAGLPYGGTDPRLRFQAAQPTTVVNEGTGADGGFVIPAAFSTEILTLSDTEASLLPFCDVIPIGSGNSMGIPHDDSAPWGTDGVRAYWQSEASLLPQQKPVMKGNWLHLKKVLALIPLSEEIAQDAPALNRYLPRRIGDAIRYKVNEALLFGTGVGQPLGCMNSNAAIVMAKESGQAANTVVVQNFAKMFSALPPGAHQRAVWLVNPDTLALGLSLGALAFPMTAPLPAYPGSCGTLLGRPVYVSQHPAALSSQGDVILVDLSYVTAIVKSMEPTTALSVHLYFDAACEAFKASFRIDAYPRINAPLAPAKGANNMSPFILLGAR
jgi:HK97 family phage major capsid protein